RVAPLPVTPAVSGWATPLIETSTTIPATYPDGAGATCSTRAPRRNSSLPIRKRFPSEEGVAPADFATVASDSTQRRERLGSLPVLTRCIPPLTQARHSKAKVNAGISVESSLL